jgi:hypothetical protein
LYEFYGSQNIDTGAYYSNIFSQLINKSRMCMKYTFKIPRQIKIKIFNKATDLITFRRVNKVI